jgi:hypothetical protein
MLSQVIINSSEMQIENLVAIAMGFAHQSAMIYFLQTNLES